MTGTAPIRMRVPVVADGPALWRMAVDSAILDVNTPYAYALWCRDFAKTSVIAEADHTPAGFITGYLRPEEPETLMVWQVAVNSDHRGAGVAGRMLDHLAERLRPHGITHLETTVTPDNTASQRLFTAFAGRQDAPVERSELFGSELLGDGHLAEELFRIGPFGTAGGEAAG